MRVALGGKRVGVAEQPADNLQTEAARNEMRGVSVAVIVKAIIFEPSLLRYPSPKLLNVLKPLTEARHEVASAKGQSRSTLPNNPLTEQLEKESAKLDDHIVEMQRAAVKPQPYQFVIRRVESTANKNK